MKKYFNTWKRNDDEYAFLLVYVIGDEDAYILTARIIDNKILLDTMIEDGWCARKNIETFLRFGPVRCLKMMSDMGIENGYEIEEVKIETEKRGENDGTQIQNTQPWGVSPS